MKKIFLGALLFVSIFFVFQAFTPQVNVGTVQQTDQRAVITFDTTTYNFGRFSEKSPVVKCRFHFKNTGSAPLIINQALASCGCTVPEYPKDPIQAGDTASIAVTYNGQGKFPGHFKKSITVRSNAKNDVVRLYVEGDMYSEAKP